MKPKVLSPARSSTATCDIVSRSKRTTLLLSYAVVYPKPPAAMPKWKFTSSASLPTVGRSTSGRSRTDTADEDHSKHVG